jgi:DNA-binding transcriptional ArsR family regulator
MDHGSFDPDPRIAALGLLRALRAVDALAGVRNSRIAFDVALLFFEAAMEQPPASLSVDQIAATTGYSGPTVRLVLKRLLVAEVIVPGRRVGKTQLYGMTPKGVAGFDGYVEAIKAFRQS